MTDKYINFDEYIRQGEPAQREAAYAWSTAIGLQAVDGGVPKGQPAASPMQRIGILTSHGQCPWRISTMRIITAPKGHKHQEYGTIAL